jgi:hypothetical protein
MKYIIYFILCLVSTQLLAEETIYNTAFIRRVEISNKPDICMIETVQDGSNRTYIVYTTDSFHSLWMRLVQNPKFIKVNRVPNPFDLPR